MLYICWFEKRRPTALSRKTKRKPNISRLCLFPSKEDPDRPVSVGGAEGKQWQEDGSRLKWCARSWGRGGRWRTGALLHLTTGNMMLRFSSKHIPELSTPSVRSFNLATKWKVAAAGTLGLFTVWRFHTDPETVGTQLLLPGRSCICRIPLTSASFQ